jgi:hypothetical protein
METRNSKKRKNKKNPPPPNDDYPDDFDDENDEDYVEEEDGDELEEDFYYKKNKENENYKYLDYKDILVLKNLKKQKNNILYKRFHTSKELISQREVNIIDILTCNIPDEKRANLVEKLECLRQLEPCTDDYIQTRDQLRSMYIKYTILDNVVPNFPNLNLNVSKSPLLQPQQVAQDDTGAFKKKISELICSNTNRKVLEEKLDEFDDCMKGEEKNKIKRWLSVALTLPFDRVTPHISDEKQITTKLQETQDFLNKRLYGMENVKERLMLFLNKKLREANSRGCNIALLGKPGVGKCLHPETEIIMYDLSLKKAKDVVVGDLLLGDDNTPRRVLSTVKGREEMYSVRQEYGEMYIVNKSHILTLRRRSDGKVVDIPIMDVINKESEYTPVGASYFNNQLGSQQNISSLDFSYNVGKNISQEMSKMTMDPMIKTEYLKWSKLEKLSFMEGLIHGSQIVKTDHNKLSIHIPNGRPILSSMNLIRSMGMRCIIDQQYHQQYLVILKPISHTNSIIENFSIQSTGDGDYCGFTLDSNERFVLADWTVTHNTAIAKSLAACLNLPFSQVSFGGVTNPDFLMGHDYTYIGSRPGEISRCLIRMGTKNGILFFDEFDKATDKKEIMSTLLHVTDFSQNNEFRDNYFPELTQDLSKIWFIYSMNQLPTDPAMLDRLEVINVDEYNAEERKLICKNYLFPKYIDELKISKSVVITDDGISRIIQLANGKDTKKGVRDLERCINLIIEKVYFYLCNTGSTEYEESYPWYKQIASSVDNKRVVINEKVAEMILKHCKKDNEVYLHMYM